MRRTAMRTTRQHRTATQRPLTRAPAQQRRTLTTQERQERQERRGPQRTRRTQRTACAGRDARASGRELRGTASGRPSLPRSLILSLGSWRSDRPERAVLRVRCGSLRFAAVLRGRAPARYVVCVRPCCAGARVSGRCVAVRRGRQRSPVLRAFFSTQRLRSPFRYSGSSAIPESSRPRCQPGRAMPRPGRYLIHPEPPVPDSGDP